MIDDPRKAPDGEGRGATLGQPADMILGGTLRRLRRAAGLTQRDAAKALGVSYQQIQKYEKGASRLSAAVVPILADLYRQPCSSFFEYLSSGAAPPAPSAFADRVYGQIAALEDADLRHKIMRVVEILAS